MQGIRFHRLLGSEQVGPCPGVSCAVALSRKRKGRPGDDADHEHDDKELHPREAVLEPGSAPRAGVRAGKHLKLRLAQWPPGGPERACQPRSSRATSRISGRRLSSSEHPVPTARTASAALIRCHAKVVPTGTSLFPSMDSISVRGPEPLSLRCQGQVVGERPPAAFRAA